MHNQYNPKSCNVLEKAYYTPLEAAIRWCGLFDEEEYIFKRMEEVWGVPPLTMFPQWPCLRINVVKIFDAVWERVLPCTAGPVFEPDYYWKGCEPESTYKKHPVYFAKDPPDWVINLTVQCEDLKKWITEYHPDQRPAFLFNEIERKITPVISVEDLRALQADRDSLKANFDIEISERNALEEKYNISITEKEALLKIIDDLKSQLNDACLAERSERSYQNMVAALLECISGVLPDFKKSPSFVSEAKLIEAIASYYVKYDGLSHSNLSRKFPECKRNLKNQ